MKRVLLAVLLGAGIGAAWVSYDRLFRADRDAAAADEGAPPMPAPKSQVARAAEQPPPIEDDAAPTGAHFLALAQRAGAPDEGASAGPDRGRHDELEEILAEGDVDEAWTASIKTELDALVAEDPALSAESVRCAGGLCGLKLNKPNSSKLDWRDIDQRLSKRVEGEKIFVAGSDGKQSTAYVYFAGREGRLPLDPQQSEREE